MSIDQRSRLLLIALCTVAACGGGGADDDDGGRTDATTHDDGGTVDARIGPDAEARAITCRTQWPLASQTAVGHETERLYAQLHVDGISPSPSAEPRLAVDVGVGPAGSSPSDASWSWSPATRNADCLACEDREEWMGTATPTATGAHVWAARVAWDGGPWTYCDRADDGRPGSANGWAEADAPPVTANAVAPVKLVSLNLRCLVDDWDARLPIVVDALAAADADAYGLQENCAGGGRDNLAELVTALSARTGKTYTVTRTVTHRSWDSTYDEGPAVVTPHAVRATSFVDLPDGVFPRRGVFVRLVGPQGPMVFATTHLDHLDANARRTQATVLVAGADAFALPGELTILTGDYNGGPTEDAHGVIAGAGFTDTWAALHAGDAGPTFPSSGPTSRIDYVWLRAGTTGFTAATIDRILTTAVGGVYGSDHVGLSATITR